MLAKTLSIILYTPPIKLIGLKSLTSTMSLFLGMRQIKVALRLFFKIYCGQKILKGLHHISLDYTPTRLEEGQIISIKAWSLINIEILNHPKQNSLSNHSDFSLRMLLWTQGVFELPPNFCNGLGIINIASSRGKTFDFTTKV